MAQDLASGSKMRYDSSMNNKPMIQVTLENGREINSLFYDMDPAHAMEQALKDRPGFWIKDVKVITEYTQMNGEESFYDSFGPADRYEQRTSSPKEADYGLTTSPWAAY